MNAQQRHFMLWDDMTKYAGGIQGDQIGVGKSRAKVYGKERTNIRFINVVGASHEYP